VASRKLLVSTNKYGSRWLIVPDDVRDLDGKGGRDVVSKRRNGARNGRLLIGTGLMGVRGWGMMIIGIRIIGGRRLRPMGMWMVGVKLVMWRG